MNELDILVAKEIMGWDIQFLFKWQPWNDGSTGGFAAEWSPSTDIAQAWRVLEQFRFRDGMGVILIEDTWICEIFMGVKMHRVEANTAPMAICLAALKAKGIEAPPTAR